MKVVKKIIKILFVISLVVLGVSFFFRNTLPGSEEVLSEVLKEPVQEEVTTEPVVFEKDEYKATIEPLYSYELYGLIVTQYDSDIWYDQMHKDDPFNTKDLCVVWGSNIKTEAYLKGKYRHGEFTCYWNFKTMNDYKQFSESEVSNNHLIPANESLMKEIKKTGIGDQVYVKGYLSNYSVLVDDSTIFTRGTSTTREDRGDRSCETIYVTDFSILKKNNHPFVLIFQYVKYVTLFLLVVLIILFFVERKEFSSKTE